MHRARLMIYALLISPLLWGSWTRFEHFADPLTQQIVYAMHQDREGNYWIATHAGLNRFDGTNFQQWRVDDGLKYGTIRAVIEDQDGHIWLGVQGNVVRFDGQQFTHFNQGLDVDQIYSLLLTKDGTFYCGSNEGLYIFSDGVFEKIPGTSGLYACLIEDQDGVVWAGRNAGLQRIVDGKLRDEGFETLAAQRIYGLFNKDRSVWVSAASGVYQISNNQLTVRHENKGAWTPGGGILVDRFDHVLVGTNRGLLEISDRDIKLWDETDGLPNAIVYCILENTEGTIVLGGIPGISLWTGRPFVNYSMADGLPNSTVRGLLLDRNDTIWAGTFGGLARKTEQGFEVYGKAQGLENDFVMSLSQTDAGIFLIGTRGGLFTLQDAVIKRVKAVPENEIVFDIAEGPEGGWWVGTYDHGLKRTMDGINLETFDVPGFSLHRPRLLRDSRNRMWVSSTDGLLYWEKGQWHTFTIDDGLAGKGTYALYEAVDGEIWWGYRGRFGFSRWNNGRIINYNNRGGQKNAQVYVIGDSQDGALWLGGDSGLDQFEDGHFYNHNTHDGIINNESNSGSFVRDRNGELWFGTLGGLINYRPQFNIRKNLSPKPSFGPIAVNDVPITRQKNFKHPNNDLTASFVIKNVSARHHLDVETRLLGHEDWTPMDQPVRRFNDLDPGTYNLQLRARFSGEPWVGIATPSFEIRPPWWKTWPALIGFALLVLGLIALVLRQRINIVERQKQKLEKLVTERTATLTKEVAEHQATQQELLAAQDELVTQAHSQGRADIATGVLHNIGNIMSSVTTSAGMIRENLEKSKVAKLDAAVRLLKDHQDDLKAFIANDPKGESLLRYIIQVEEMLRQERDDHMESVMRMLEKTDLIRGYIMMHQSYARANFFEDNVSIVEQVEDALLLQANSMDRHHIQLIKEIEPVPPIRVQKAKLVNILINLYKNAKEAMEDMSPEDRYLRIRLYHRNREVVLSVGDNGHGIDPEHLSKLFSQGFTTKDTGHGFGLHSCANYMREMGGRIEGYSKGLGEGATFTLYFPTESNEDLRKDTQPNPEEALLSQG